MKKSKRNYLIIALIVLLLCLAVGYAAFSDTLTISGTANAKGTFDMQIASATIDTATAKGINTTTSSATISEDKNSVNVNIKDLAYPGAGTNVTVIVKNNGTVPAKLTGLTFEGVDDPDIQVAFPTSLATGEVVQAGATCQITFSVKWKLDSTLELTDSTEKSISFSAKLDYTQDTTAFEGTASHTDA